MTGAKTMAAGVASYELAIEIEAPRERVWEALTEETNAWWLPDFHMVGEGSVVTLDTRAGGGLIEHLEGGGSLLWYTVLWHQPEEFGLYLVGHTAPEWGGPNTSILALTVEATDENVSVLVVHDSRHGHIDEAGLQSLQEGWTWLFTDGLKKFVEVGSI